MATKKTETTAISIPAIEIRTATIKVVGDSPLIMHAWSDKAKQMILDKQMKKAKSKGHDAKNPVEDFIESMYWLNGKPEEYTEEAFAEAIENGATRYRVIQSTVSLTPLLRTACVFSTSTSVRTSTLRRLSRSLSSAPM